MVASGTLRLGFSITPAETAALSTPRNAHRAIEALLVMAWPTGMESGFQPAANTAGWNQNQPSRPTKAIGKMPAMLLTVVKRPMVLAPRVLSQMNRQMIAAVQALASQGFLSTGK